MDFYKKEILNLLTPLKIKNVYFGWELDEISFHKSGPYYLEKVIFRFVKTDNELRIYLNNNLHIDYQSINYDKNIVKIFFLIKELLNSKNKDIKKCLFYSALSKNNSEFFNRLNSSPLNKLLNFFNFYKLEIINKPLNFKNKKIKIILDYNLNCYGIGDFIRHSREEQRFGNSTVIAVTDLISLFNKKYSAIYTDLLSCFIKNNIFNKKIKIIDYNIDLNYLDSKLSETYYLFLYNQYFNLYSYINKGFNFKKFLYNPKAGVKYLINKLNNKGIAILIRERTSPQKNKIFVNQNFYNLIKNKINLKKIIIGISANYPLGYPRVAQKGWAHEKWADLIDILNKKFKNLSFFLLPVNILNFYELNISESTFNYHYLLYQKFKDLLDINYLDKEIYNEILKSNLFRDDIILKNSMLEFLKSSISLCDLVIALDSGPAHLAASLNIPVVSLFSEKGQPKGFKPLGRNSYSFFKEKDGKYLNINQISAQELLDFLIAKNLIISR